MALFGFGFVAKKAAAAVAGPILHEVAETVGVSQPTREVAKTALDRGASLGIAAATLDPSALLD